MKHTNTNTIGGIYTHDGKHLRGVAILRTRKTSVLIHTPVTRAGRGWYARWYKEFAASPVKTYERVTVRGVRPIKRRKDGARVRRPLLLTAEAAALEAAHSTIKHAYRTQGANGGTLAAISAAVTNGDEAAYKALSRKFDASATAEAGLWSVRRAIISAKATAARLAHVDEATRTAAVYDALSTDTSGAALEMYGAAFVEVYERRGHAGAALFYGVQYRAACNAAARVLYAAKVQNVRAVASVEEWTRGELVGVAPVPSAWDVYTFDELAYLRRERDRIAAAAGHKYAARFIECRLQGLTLDATARRLGVCLRTCKSIAAAVRAAYNETHGTAYGSAHERARQA